MLETLANGGPFTWAIIIWALALYTAIFREIGKQRAQFASALWGGLAGMVLLGIFATAVGFIEAGEVADARFGLVASIAVIPLAAASLLGVPAALLIGVSLTTRSRQPA